MSRYHAAAGTVGRLWPRVRDSLSRALSRLSPGTAEDWDALAASLEEAVGEAVEAHRAEADRRRRFRETWRQFERNRRELGVE